MKRCWSNKRFSLTFLITILIVIQNGLICLPWNSAWDALHFFNCFSTHKVSPTLKFQSINCSFINFICSFFGIIVYLIINYAFNCLKFHLGIILKPLNFVKFIRIEVLNRIAMLCNIASRSFKGTNFLWMNSCWGILCCLMMMCWWFLLMPTTQSVYIWWTLGTTIQISFWKTICFIFHIWILA